MDDLDGGLTGGMTSRAEGALGLPYPREGIVGLIALPFPPVMPDLPPDRAVRYLMRLYVGWCRVHFNGSGRGFAQGSTARVVADAARIMQRRGDRPALWLRATEGAWRAIREGSADRTARTALHPAPGWVYSPARLASYRSPTATPVPQLQGHPHYAALLAWWRGAVVDLSATPPLDRPARTAELRAEYESRVASARRSVDAANALNDRLVAEGEWLWG